MIETYEQALEWIHHRLQFGMKPGLERMTWMMGKLGNPQHNIKTIHVAGTNGKGSTVTYLRNILQAAGYHVGTFTSPYIETFNERISVDGVPISNQEIVSLVQTIEPLAEELDTTDLGSLTEFETITVMMYYYFGEVNPQDFHIIEVGLGGRLDSTNIIKPELSIITSIGRDHMNILGNSIADIAGEKAGIIKSGVPVISGAQQEEAVTVIKKCAETHQAKLSNLTEEIFVNHTNTLHDGEAFSYKDDAVTFEELTISMLGAHQVNNAALAIKAALLLGIEENAIRTGCKKASWPGRMEILSEEPLVIVDGAHNPEGVQAFVATVNSHYADKEKTIVFSALQDKDLSTMFAELLKVEANFYFTEFDYPRKATAAYLKKQSGWSDAKIHSDWQELLNDLLKKQDKNSVLFVTGSLYFISGVKKYMTKLIEK